MVADPQHLREGGQTGAAAPGAFEFERQVAIARYMRSATRAAALVAARLDLNHVLETVVNVLSQDLEAALAQIWLLDGDRLVVGASAGGHGEEPGLGDRVATGDPSPVAEVARSRLPLVKADLGADPRFCLDWLDRQGIGAGVILPLTLGRDLHGVLACYFRSPPPDELVEVLFTFAAMIASSVNDITLLRREQAARAEAEAAQARLAVEREAAESRARALAQANEALSAHHDELNLARRRLAAQYAVLQALAVSPTLEEAAPKILEAIGTSMEWDLGTLWLHDARGACLHPSEIWMSPSTGPHDFIARARKVTYAVGEGLVGRVFQTGEPAWMDDATKSPSFRRAELAAAAGLHGAVWFPVRHGAEVFGVVEFFRRDTRTADEETLLAISALGRQIGQFIERVHTESALRESEERLGTTLRSIGDGVVATDPEGRVEYMNPIAESLTGWRSDEARGLRLEQVVRIVDPGTREPEPAPPGLPDADPGAEPAADTLLLARDGRGIFVEKSAGPILDPRGEPVGVVLVFRDVTDKRRADARRRFVAEASALLASSLDYERTLVGIARAAVPAVADWCAVELNEADRLRPLALVHDDPPRLERARLMRDRFAPDPRSPHGFGQVLQTGEPLLVAELGPARLAAAARDPDHFELLDSLALGSAMLAPITARGGTHGVVALANDRASRSFDSADLAMAQELGRRIGLALDNARLFQQAQEAVRARDEFLSIASHELKTPLTSLRLHVQGLEREARRGGLDTERTLAKLQTADQQAVRLADLINDLLDLSHITAGRLHLAPERLDLTAVSREVAGHFADTLGRAGSTLELWSPGPVVGHWDRMRLEQILTNLLSNAVKYGGGKPIRLSLERAEGAAVLTVRDQGIGIAPEDLERIFARFERAVSARHYGGLGVGLYIVRRVVDAMGGSIEVSSALGAGSTFRVRLPLPTAVGRSLVSP